MNLLVTICVIKVRHPQVSSNTRASLDDYNFCLLTEQFELFISESTVAHVLM